MLATTKKLVNQFFEGNFTGGQFSGWCNFLGGDFAVGNISEDNFPGAVFWKVFF